MNEPLPARSLILIIDDDEILHLMMHHILEREGFKVLYASSGIEGIETIKNQEPELVFLDVMMPEMDGFHCLQVIRAIPGMQLLPIVMLTGLDDNDSINHSFELGATDFIAKPINWPILPHRLRYLLRASSALNQLEKSEAELRTAQKIAHLGSWNWTVASDKMEWSDEVFNVLDVDSDDFQGRRLDLYKNLQSFDVDKLHELIENCVRNKQNFHLQLHIYRANGSDQIVLMRGEPLISGHHVTHVQGTVQDITDRHRVEEQIRFLSFYDPLTGLPNRKLFKEILGQAIAYCNRYKAILSALFISIDRFERINENLGTSVGDRVVKMFADRLVTHVRDCDYVAVNADPDAYELPVSKLGGNEFTVLLNHIHDTPDSVKVAKRIFQVMSEPFNIGEQEIFLGINVGIAVYPGDGTDEDSFIKNAEFAMSHAKQQGQDTYQFFNKSFNAAAVHKLSMENNLRHAIERNQLIVYYQPKINMQKKCVIGCEALLRWQHPEFGLVPPSEFIPIAEDSGLIIDISNWVLEAACKQMRLWRQQGLKPLVTAVNVSASQFRQSDFVAQIDKLLTRMDLAPKYLKLELTESILLGHIEDTLASLREFRALGVQISIDDFGTGYSSLAYLKKLPISELKIDRSFIQDIPYNEDDMAITTAILALAKSLSLEVVAEGVEHEEQAAFLMQQGCEIAQGFLYSKPVPAAEFVAFVEQFGGVVRQANKL
ncbi:MAG: EAL domain-containing protein [Methylococcales bacterium]|nr:EAL domain-containing protein [Methylococcales bacterium]